jgi:hypothetical protein
MNASAGSIGVGHRRGVDRSRALVIAAVLVATSAAGFAAGRMSGSDEGRTSLTTIEAPAPVIPNLAHRPPHHIGSVKVGQSGAFGG